MQHFLYESNMYRRTLCCLDSFGLDGLPCENSFVAWPAECLRILLNGKGRHLNFCILVIILNENGLKVLV